MTLPKVHAPHETIDIGGALFDVRVLTSADAARFQRMVEDNTAKDILEIEVIAAATDTPVDETKDWYGATPAWVVEELIGHIQRTSRLTGEAQKSGREGDSARDG
jgi:hypothetical protein